MKPRIRFLGFDSMGTRGMATVVDTGSLKIFIDPGVSYAPRRYGLPPHRVELDRFNYFLEEIHREALDSDVFVITHYHRDHYLYREGEEEYYRGKKLYIKHPLENINHSQRIRAYVLLNKMRVNEIAGSIDIADGKEYIIDKDVKLIFSRPVPHGPDGTALGYVVMSLVDINGYRILHASDVQGPMSTSALEFIISLRPNLLVISGPPTYLEGYRMSSSHIEAGLNNLVKIITSIEELEIILDHHLLRDLQYRNRVNSIFRYAREYGVRIVTAAEYMGKPVEQLEAMRKKLWEENP